MREEATSTAEFLTSMITEIHSCIFVKFMSLVTVFRLDSRLNPDGLYNFAILDKL